MSRLDPSSAGHSRPAMWRNREAPNALDLGWSPLISVHFDQLLTRKDLSRAFYLPDARGLGTGVLQARAASVGTGSQVYSYADVPVSTCVSKWSHPNTSVCNDTSLSPSFSPSFLFLPFFRC